MSEKGECGSLCLCCHVRLRIGQFYGMAESEHWELLFVCNFGFDHLGYVAVNMSLSIYLHPMTLTLTHC